ncbi:RNA polymerase sigma factor [Pedobacter metabolipauper]|uniref:RNA polymerase sigma-70 factor (ECF subfamily) n=1 Tax=Pedobacter metabolipauper TaxID=425513 RepID=A0A4R6STW8_9SPHI|nr:RNA polymerase sigma-70 factor [Pedobacter metabolipauper]TDQ07486.1 RNA polymerase sigma-70 factor (ECF subfamily) [Pedobacter metabolipauper]
MENVNDLTNEQLLTSIRLGDCASFNEIYHRYRKKVYGFAYRFTRSSEQAEELTQDVFVRVWENRSKIDSAKNFDGFLFILIRNNYLKALRHSAKESVFNVENLEEEPSNNAIDDYIDLKDCQQIASLAINSLSPQAKIAFQLSRNEGFSHEDISRQMGISKNTVNNHIKKSLGTVRKYMQVYSSETVLSLILLTFF